MADSTVYSTAISPGAPPLRWDNIYEAFRQVNANFEILEAALGAAGITPINFSDLDSNVIPSTSASYTLGTIAKQWKSVHAAEYVDIPGNELNGLWAGNAQIKGIGFTVDLPLNSTVDGSLIIDPSKNWFQTIEVDNNESIVATEVNDSFGMLSGNGISLTVDSAAESLTITNTGILDVTAGAGISRTIVSGTANIVNTGVLSLTNTGLLGTRTSGAGIHVSSSTGNTVITNTGVVSLSAGTGISISPDAVTGDYQINNTATAQPAFQQVEVDGDSGNRLVADSTAGVFKVVSGYAISLSKNTLTDTMTISVNPEHDLVGSVFGDDSTLLVDGVASRVVGPVYTSTLRTSESSIALGYQARSSSNTNYSVGIGWQAALTDQAGYAVAIGQRAGETSQGQSSISIGPLAGQTSQGATAIAIGEYAGNTGQGTDAVAIGNLAGYTNQGANSIMIGRSAGASSSAANSIALNASGSLLNPSAAGFYVNPIRSTATATGPMMYNPTTKEVFYNTVLEFAGSTISTNDSSGIIVDVQTTFNTDVRAENDLVVVQTLTANQITTNGIRGYISTSGLKTLVAESSSFADFQARIAGLNTNIAL